MSKHNDGLKLRKGVYYAYTYYFDPETGKRKLDRRSTGVKDNGTFEARKRAREERAKIERYLSNPRDREDRTPTLEAALAKLARNRKISASDATRDIGRRKAPALLNFFGPDTTLGSITNDRLAEFAEARLAAPAAPASIIRELAELSAAFTACDLKLPKRPKLKPRVVERWLTPEECSRLLAELEPERRRTIAFALQTGVRLSELWKWQRIAPDLIRIGGTKTKKSDRVIPLTAVARECIAAGPFTRWLRGNMHRELQRAAKRAGIDGLSANDLRRTFATQLVLRNVSTKRIADLLGHTTTAMVERIYARVRANELHADAIAALPAYETGVLNVCEQSSLLEPGQAGEEEE